MDLVEILISYLTSRLPVDCPSSHHRIPYLQRNNGRQRPAHYSRNRFSPPEEEEEDCLPWDLADLRRQISFYTIIPNTGNDATTTNSNSGATATPPRLHRHR
jgi:hypothetical protein